ncbi:MAG: nucleotidyltransferase domain-containing protein [Anaerolineales bacterium]|jgi:predicted nucleotidyltransferase
MSGVDWQLAKKVFESNPNVVAAWVFGSAKEGKIRPGGDLDLSVLFDKSPSLDERVELLIQLQRALNIDDVDLVVLNDASPITRFEAVSGRLIFSRDASKQAEFVSLTAREYEDEMALLLWGLNNRP